MSPLLLDVRPAEECGLTITVISSSQKTNSPINTNNILNRRNVCIRYSICYWYVNCGLKETIIPNPFLIPFHSRNAYVTPALPRSWTLLPFLPVFLCLFLQSGDLLVLLG